MKLASAIIERTLDQFEAEALPDNPPAVPQLSELFGDHTFFLDANGLNIVEPAESNRAEVQTWKVVKLASSHKPEPTDVVIALPSNLSNGAT